MPFKRLVLYDAPFDLLWGTAHAACGPVPAGNNDLGISFLQAGGTQIAPVGQLASSVARGVVVYDASDNRLKLCDGTDWVTVGAGGGGGAVGGLGEVQFRRADRRRRGQGAGRQPRDDVDDGWWHQHG